MHIESKKQDSTFKYNHICSGQNTEKGVLICETYKYAQIVSMAV
jgi:hypothetical protein